MTRMRVVGWTGVSVMVAALIYGFATGDFGTEGSEILGLAWGRVTLIDLYTGLALIGVWIVWRERSLLRALPWLVGMVFMGSLAAALYLVVAAHTGREASTEDR